jgi:cytidine deaminase
MSADVDWEGLKAAAAAARENAHAPYSRFKVGAAVQAGGRIFAGCNVENASYPVGLCAERAALAAAVAAGCKAIEAVVVVADRPLTPCGMCRQALAEFNPKVPILCVSDAEEAQATLAQLLPDPFSLSD